MAKRKKQLTNYVEYGLFRALIWKLKLLPYAWSRKLLLGLFCLIAYKIGIRKQVAHTQLQKVFPQLDQRSRNLIIRKMYRGMALSAAEEYLLDDSKLISESKIKGLEHWQKALELGHGAILGTAHFGNWEAARILPAKGIPLSVITKRQRNILFDAYTNRIRTRHGLHVLDMRRGLRDIIQHLKQNEMVAILADQNAGKQGLIFDFMGYPASHWIGVAKISLRYKVPIIPGFALRSPDEHIVFCLEPMIYHPELEDTDENYELILRELDKVLIKYIEQYPEQWFWVHKRWKGAYDMFGTNY